MALNSNDRIAVFATMAEALGRTWQLKLPLAVLAYLMVVPWAIAMALGFFDPLSDFMAISATQDYSAIMGQYPYGTLLILWVAGGAISIVFAIFWYRYLLLGREGALKFGLGAFNGMFWRMFGYGVVVLLAAFVVLILCFVLAVAIATVLTMVFAQGSQTAAFGFGFIAGLAAYIVPVALVVRFSLVFAAIAVGESLSLGESWALTRGTTWRIFGALMLLFVPFGILVYAINFAVLYALGVNLFDPQSVAAVFDLWWVTLVLAPLMTLPMALAYAVVALAYRDLSGPGGATVPAGDQSFAH